MYPSQSETKATPSSEHLAALDQLRGLAILAVIWHHFNDKIFPMGWWIDSPNPVGAFGAIVANGWLGVNLFFILSGFVLYWPLATRKRTLTTREDLIHFYTRRAKRLLPLYFFSVFLLIGLVGGSTPRSVVLLSTFSFIFLPSHFFPDINWVLWSLGIEIWFSILFPIVVLSILHLGWIRTALIIFLTSALTRLVGTQMMHTDTAEIAVLNPVKDSIIGRLDDFFVGMILAHWHAQGFRVTRAPLLLGGGIVVCAFAGVYSDLTVKAHLPIWAMAFTYTILQVGVSLVLLAALSLQGIRIWTLELCGMMCYSLYIWHGVLMNHLTPHPHTGGKMRFIAVLLIVSWFSYRYIEFGHIKQVAAILPRPKGIQR